MTAHVGLPPALRSLTGGLAAILVLHLVLIQPNHPGALALGALSLVPLELPVIVLGLVIARGRAARALATAVAAVLTVMVVVKTADFASNVAFGRPFNPAVDYPLAPAAWRMLSGALGTVPALAAAVALVLVAALAGWAILGATRRLAAISPPPGARPALGLAMAIALGLAVLDAAREIRPFNPPGAAFTARLAWEHVRDIGRARADLVEFRAAAAQDPLADTPPGVALPALAGHDILIIFVESYGRAALDRAPFADVMTKTLHELESRLAAAGLAARSGFLASPTVGGQSWLAHTTLLSGLKIDDQSRYRALFASARRTLITLARDAGWRTVAVMPAITLAWPEADWFGYDRVLAAADLGYAGAPFNWITMPDQFTLASFERAELDVADRAPVFAEIALISSHAPWTPLAPVLSWEELGNGRVFTPFATAGPSPEELWRDTDRLRDAYAATLSYSLTVAVDFVARRASAGTPPVAVVLGDHQAANFVTGDADRRDVPIHVLGPPDIVDRLTAWGWTPGMVPAAEAPVRPMDEFRDHFFLTFSEHASGARSESMLHSLPGRR